jgi:hypothetical protein
MSTLGITPLHYQSSIHKMATVKTWAEGLAEKQKQNMCADRITWNLRAANHVGKLLKYIAMRYIIPDANSRMGHTC